MPSAGGSRLSCSGEIVPIAINTIRALLRLPPADLLEEVKVPVRAATDKTVSISYARKQRIRYGLGFRHDDKTHFRSSARQVVAILAQHYNLDTLVQGAGPVGETDEETAGIRFLGRLIDAAIGGRERPPALRRAVERICQTFEAQLTAGDVEVDWCYPVPGLVLTRPLRLSNSVNLQEIGEERFELLGRYAEGGLVSQNVLLQVSTTLAIRARAKMPFGHTGRENSDVLHKLVLAFLLSDLPLPLLLTSWPESLEPSVFELGHASWFTPWSSSPLAFFHHLTPTSSQISTLRRIYKMVESCTEEILYSLPVRRAISAATRADYEDRLIDIWIALEALLLRKDESTELQYRMAGRAAWIVRPPLFREFQQTFKDAYNDRSKVVHGSRHATKGENLQRCNWIFSLLKRIILHSIQQTHLPDLMSIEEKIFGKLRRST